MSPGEQAEILAANEAFYRAFTARDLDAMDALWSPRATVSCIHPGWDALHGRGEVMASWRAILANPTAPPVSCARASLYLVGDVALVVCTEIVEGSELIATNVFAHEDGAWRMVHHQAGPVSRRSPAVIKAPPPRQLN